MQYKHIDGIRVEVENVVYMPNLQSPPDKPYPYVYFLSIYNDSEEEIQILGRKWIVDEERDGCIVVEGQGVVGENPMIATGEKFSYNSYHVIASKAEVSGAFYGKTQSGDWFTVVVPEFTLRVP